MRLFFLLGLLITGCSSNKNAPMCEDVEGLQVEFHSEVPDNYKGLVKTCHDNGKLESRVGYMNGMRDGEFVWYYYNGRIWFETSYVNGKSQEWIYYDE